MSILIEALGMLCEAVVTAESSTKLYNEIENAIRNSEWGNEPDGSATNSWVTGFTHSRSEFGKHQSLVYQMRKDQLDPNSKEFRDAKRSEIAFNILVARGLFYVDKETGKYHISTQPEKREEMSRFRQFVSSGFNQDKVNADPSKYVRQAGDDASREWAAKLPPEGKKMLEIYKKMDKGTLGFLKSLMQVRTQIAEFRKRVNFAKYKDSVEYLNLKNLRFLTDDDKIDLAFVKKYNAFTVDPMGDNSNAYALLKPFQREGDFYTTRTTADHAIARNAVDKRLDSYSDTATDDDRNVQSIMGDLTPAEIQHMISLHKGEEIDPAAMSNLLRSGLLDSDGSFTDIGKAVAASLNVNPDVDSFNSAAIKQSRMTGIRGERRAERTVDRKATFKQYTGINGLN